jgi:galactose oxidase
MNLNLGKIQTGTLSVAAALVLAAFPLPARGQPAKTGQWDNKFDLPNVAIHMHMLPTGNVLFWSRREWKDGKPLGGLDPHDCTPRIWNPATSEVTETPHPGVNLFCSSHTFLPDGRLFVVGGHIADGQGSDSATIYDPFQNTWTSTAPTSGGRWYPTAITLADGSVLASFGNVKDVTLNDTQQVWKDGTWRTIVNFDAPPLFPRMHLIPGGRVFMSGPLALTQFLDTSPMSNWTFLNPDMNKSFRINGFRDYAPSVMLASGKILFIGGGNAPTNAAEILDLTQPGPAWAPSMPMSIGRRHHNATILPDGTILVNGGTSGNGGPNNGFNDLSQPVLKAELWDPTTGLWTDMAAESTPRCYHSTSILLPDARVLSAGGGEYRPDNINDNDPKDSHLDAQIFNPPYLFRGGTRLAITSAPAQVSYNEAFQVVVSDLHQISQVTWVRLSSVTHAFNTNQRILFLDSTVGPTSLAVKAPADPSICPPGHYMMFVLDKQKVPSIATIINIR